MRRVTLATAFTCLALAAIAAEPGIPPEQSYAERGAEILKPFKMAMKKALVEGLSSGPAEAIDACRVEAPALAAQFSTNDVVVGRSSHRLRNPANHGPAWIEDTLAYYVDNPGERTPVVVTLDEGRAGYIEPIDTAPLCLACHGKVLEPSVRETIETLYPDDEATGFDAGDLRGVFWVEFPR